MIDPQTCTCARATLCDAIAQLLEAGHMLAAVQTATSSVQTIAGLAEDIGVLARALQVFERRSDDG